MNSETDGKLPPPKMLTFALCCYIYCCSSLWFPSGTLANPFPQGQYHNRGSRADCSQC